MPRAWGEIASSNCPCRSETLRHPSSPSQIFGSDGSEGVSARAIPPPRARSEMSLIGCFAPSRSLPANFRPGMWTIDAPSELGDGTVRNTHDRGRSTAATASLLFFLLKRNRPSESVRVRIVPSPPFGPTLTMTRASPTGSSPSKTWTVSSSSVPKSSLTVFPSSMRAMRVAPAAPGEPARTIVTAPGASRSRRKRPFASVRLSKACPSWRADTATSDSGRPSRPSTFPSTEPPSVSATSWIMSVSSLLRTTLRGA